MPKTKSAKKSLRKSLKKRLHNLMYENRIKKLSKEIKKLLKTREIEKAKDLLNQFYKIIDKAVKRKIIKKGAAARKKSKMAKLLNLAIKSPNPSEQKKE